MNKRTETRHVVPHEVMLALMVVLNHVEPGWENCTALVRLWLNDIREQAAKEAQ